MLCSTCHKPFSDVPLLYPIKEKNYSNSSYIASSWENAKQWFAKAFTITIFGYGAPASDNDAIELLRNAWFDESKREFEYIEVIDIDTINVEQRWRAFTPTHHLHFWEGFEKSQLWRWPRRSCESLLYSMAEGKPCDDFPLSSTDNLFELQCSMKQIAECESDNTSP